MSDASAVLKIRIFHAAAYLECGFLFISRLHKIIYYIRIVFPYRAESCALVHILAVGAGGKSLGVYALADRADEAAKRSFHAVRASAGAVYHLRRYIGAV